MDYQRLGRSGLSVSCIGLGCMSFGDPERGAHPWTLAAEESDRLIGLALDSGITLIDTANIYSLGTSEMIVGEALQRRKCRHEVVLATKVFEKMGDGPLSGGLSRQAIMRELDASLSRLQTDYIDLYIIHRWDYATPIEETMIALHDAIKSGKVRYIGASSMHAWQFVKAQYVADALGATRFVSMQSHYNLLSREEEREMLPYCLDEGIGVTPWSPLARGRLARLDRGDTPRSRTDAVQGWLYPAASEGDRRTIDALGALAKARGCAPASLALAWLLRQPGVTAPIVGITQTEQLRDAMTAVDLRLEESECDRLEAHYVPRETPEYR